MKKIFHRKVNRYGEFRFKDIIYQAPIQFADQIVRVDGDAQEFYPYGTRLDSGYPMKKITSAGI